MIDLANALILPIYIYAETDPTTLVPVGSVTALLIAVFSIFIKRASSQDQRIDEVNKKLVDSAYSDRDKVILEKESVESRLRGVVEVKDQLIEELRRKNRELELANLKLQLEKDAKNER